jgi:hypothetical protein
MAYRLGQAGRASRPVDCRHRLVRSARPTVPSFAPDLVSEHHVVLLIWRVRCGPILEVSHGSKLAAGLPLPSRGMDRALNWMICAQIRPAAAPSASVNIRRASAASRASRASTQEFAGLGVEEHQGGFLDADREAAPGEDLPGRDVAPGQVDGAVAGDGAVELEGGQGGEVRRRQVRAQRLDPGPAMVRWMTSVPAQKVTVTPERAGPSQNCFPATCMLPLAGGGNPATKIGLYASSRWLRRPVLPARTGLSGAGNNVRGEP